MKTRLRRLLQNFGIDVVRHNSATNDAIQLTTCLKVNQINTVFDIGANEGQFATSLRLNGFTGKIVSFEPLSTARSKLLQLASQDENWLIHSQAAIGEVDGTIEINIAKNSVSSSVLPMLDSHRFAAIESTYVGRETVPMLRIDSVSKSYLNPESKLLLKIDTQGFEWNVLNGSAATLRHATGVLCELSLTPLYEGQRLWLDIIERLETEGFRLWALQKGFTDLRDGRTLQLDGIFFRS